MSDQPVSCSVLLWRDLDFRPKSKTRFSLVSGLSRLWFMWMLPKPPEGGAMPVRIAGRFVMLTRGTGKHNFRLSWQIGRFGYLPKDVYRETYLAKEKDGFFPKSIGYEVLQNLIHPSSRPIDSMCSSVSSRNEELGKTSIGIPVDEDRISSVAMITGPLNWYATGLPAFCFSSSRVISYLRRIVGLDKALFAITSKLSRRT